MSDISELEELIPTISPELSVQFRDFFELVEQYNLKINLVSKGTIHRAVSKHFSDCYQAIRFIHPEINPSFPIFDFGAGNGFPGLVGAMMHPKESFILVERDQRKAEFLKIAASTMNLKNVEVHAGSLEDLSDDSCFNVISRAMAPLPKFLLQVRKVMVKGGSAFLMKGDHWSTEFTQIPAQVFEYWDVELFKTYLLPKSEGARFIVRCKKV